MALCCCRSMAAPWKCTLSSICLCIVSFVLQSFDTETCWSEQVAASFLHKQMESKSKLESASESQTEAEAEAEAELPEAGALRAALSEFFACCTDALGEYARAPSSQELLVELQRGLVALMEALGEYGVFPDRDREGGDFESLPSSSREATRASTDSSFYRSFTLPSSFGRERMSASIPRGSLKLLGESEALAATGRPVTDLSVAEVLTRVRAAVQETLPAAE